MRIILSGYNDGATNMAIDEAILEAYKQGKAPASLRIYGFRPACISIGRFQKVDEVINIQSCEKDGIDFVRRISAGEAIFHDNEITYSLIGSKDDFNLPDNIKESYFILTNFIVRAYKNLGIDAGFFNIEKDESIKRNLCFATQQGFDISVKGKKLGGNAQKRMKNIVFQQGSIPFYVEMEDLACYINEDIKQIGHNITSINEELKRLVDFNEMQSVLVDAFNKEFNVNGSIEELSTFEKELAKELKEGKYSDPEWNDKL
ncbi:MAG: lipoate--protein ligase family protein [Candidatus Omnitrophica bacterium]|nr:lipoate--protein ligase family protein [Candidatus Omnitrophota bacterium]